MTKRIIMIIIFMTTCGFFNLLCAEAADIYGMWMSDNKQQLYIINKDSTFSYYEIDSVKVFKRENLNTNNKASFYKTVKRNYTADMYKQSDFSNYGNTDTGVYEKGDRVCGIANTNTGKVLGYGNLKLYVGTSVCCLHTKFIGGKLVFEELGDGYGSYCSNQVLESFKE